MTSATAVPQEAFDLQTAEFVRAEHGPVAREVLEARTARLRDAARALGLDALVLYSSASWHGSGSATVGNVRYLTEVTDAWRGLVLVLPTAGEPALLLPGADTVMRQDVWVPDIRVERPVDQGRVARAILNDKVGPAGRAGIIGGSEMPAPTYQGLTEGKGRWVFEAADALLGRLRMVKGPEEIERHRIAARLSDAMCEAALAACRRRGAWTWQVMAAMESAARMRGAEYARTWISAAPNLEYLTRFPSDDKRQFQPGDQIMVGTYVTFDGYWGHALRTGFKGKVTPNFRRVVELLDEVQAAGFAKLRPGVPVAEIHTAMVETINRHFPGTAWGRSGHGLGLDYSDPIISDYFPDSDFPPPQTHGEILLEPGMVLELHPGFHAPELGCTAPKIGDMCLITETGYERLSRFPREIFDA